MLRTSSITSFSRAQIQKSTLLTFFSDGEREERKRRRSKESVRFYVYTQASHFLEDFSLFVEAK